jgi:hypothetical protein
MCCLINDDSYSLRKSILKVENDNKLIMKISKTKH